MEPRFPLWDARFAPVRPELEGRVEPESGRAAPEDGRLLMEAISRKGCRAEEEGIYKWRGDKARSVYNLVDKQKKGETTVDIIIKINYIPIRITKNFKKRCKIVAVGSCFKKKSIHEHRIILALGRHCTSRGSVPISSAEALGRYKLRSQI